VAQDMELTSAIRKGEPKTTILTLFSFPLS